EWQRILPPASKKKGERKSCASKDTRELMMEKLDDLRKQGTLCDVTLMVQGKHFPVHTVVLAAASNFFRLMFTTRMMESMSHEVELRGAEPEIIQLLIDFIYTSRISVNTTNVQSVLGAANLHQIQPVKKLCADFIKDQTDPTNSLGNSRNTNRLHSKHQGLAFPESGVFGNAPQSGW
uniref:BTB domain-containing protein n=1 Tax=Oryzias latipes TaxID=8090 RepID=A0A3P9KS54_ORYLA